MPWAVGRRNLDAITRLIGAALAEQHDVRAEQNAATSALDLTTRCCAILNPQKTAEVATATIPAPSAPNLDHDGITIDYTTPQESTRPRPAGAQELTRAVYPPRLTRGYVQPALPDDDKMRSDDHYR